MSGQYIYLFGASIYFLLSIGVVLYRKDLWQLVLVSGLVGGTGGLIAELWYYQDYWHPPTLRGQAMISVENFLFGFGIAAIVASVYKLSKNYQGRPKHSPRYLRSFVYLLIGTLSMFLFTNFLDINSIFTSSVAFVVIALLILYERSDLQHSAAFTAVATTVLSATIYVPLGLLAPEFWSKYYLLGDTYWGQYLIFDYLPITELIWFFSFGLLGGCLYDYVFGLELVPRNSDTNSAKS